MQPLHESASLSWDCFLPFSKGTHREPHGQPRNLSCCSLSWCLTVTAVTTGTVSLKDCWCFCCYIFKVTSSCPQSWLYTEATESSNFVSDHNTLIDSMTAEQNLLQSPFPQHSWSWDCMVHWGSEGFLLRNVFSKKHQVLTVLCDRTVYI